MDGIRIIKFLSLAAVLFLTFNVAQASSYMLLPIVEVYDGDTIKSHMNRLPEPLDKISIRLNGIDTPEMGWRAACTKEDTLAQKAKQFVVDLIGDSSTMKVENFKWDKYGGRILGDVRINGKNVAEELINAGLAIPYNGGAKTHDWCQ